MKAYKDKILMENKRNMHVERHTKKFDFQIERKTPCMKYMKILYLNLLNIKLDVHQDVELKLRLKHILDDKINIKNLIL